VLHRVGVEPALGGGYHLLNDVYGWICTPFMMNFHSRRIVGWKVADNMRSDLAIDAIKMAVWVCRHDDLDGFVQTPGCHPFPPSLEPPPTIVTPSQCS
jgi:hypothetical protein